MISLGEMLLDCTGGPQIAAEELPGNIHAALAARLDPQIRPEAVPIPVLAARPEPASCCQRSRHLLAVYDVLRHGHCKSLCCSMH